jgi:tRNA A37 threonylcarbamoyladenosine biosynthesis protein TsaE
VPVSHLDLYRFRGVSAAEWGDLEPYFEDAVVFVEWPEAGAGVIPSERASVRLRHIDEQTRGVTVETKDAGLLEAIRGDADPGV